jgi:hypothetical protein
MREDGIRNGIGDGNRDARNRYEQVIASVEPKRNRSSILKPVIVEEEKERLLEVEKLVRLGMSVEQMQDFLPTWGIPGSRSQVYRYLTDIRLPKRYKQTEREQSHHDFFTFRTFTRLARDMVVNGHRTERLQKGTSFMGHRFRPDFTFWVDRYLFFIEMQLSDIVETKWRVKFKNYLRLYLDFKRPFRVLFIIDQHGDLSYIRSAARQVLREAGRDQLNLFLFCTLNDFNRSELNLAHDPVWWPTFGGPKERVKLL